MLFLKLLKKNLMNKLELDKDQIEDIYKYAELLFVPSKIGLLIGVNQNDISTFSDLCNTEGNIYYEKYQKGKLITQAGVREKIISDAKAGSKEAQNHVIKFIDDEYFEA